MRRIIIVAAVVAAAIVVYLVSPDSSPSSKTSTSAEGALVEITLPSRLSANAQIGKTAFEAKCANCHGPNAVGQDGAGPPLIHKIYEPSHHGDESFQRAVAFGVRGHHWRFGDMAPVDGLTRADVEMIVEYVRELQRANGIN